MGEPSLEALRRTIDGIDTQILELLAARARVVLSVGRHKRERGLPIHDPSREHELIERLVREVPLPLDEDLVKRVFQQIIVESRRLEEQRDTDI